MRYVPTPLGAILLFLLLLWGTGAEAAAEQPAEVVRDFQATLLATMKDAEHTSVKQRFDRLAPSVDADFSFPAMIRIILGDQWKETPEAERTRLISAFRRMSITTLATLFDGYSGETFEVVEDREGPQNTRLVETLLKRVDDSPVDIAYITVKFSDGWRIIDVIVDKGISELTVRRSEYNRLLREGGVTALAEALDAKAESLITEH